MVPQPGQRTSYAGVTTEPLFPEMPAAHSQDYPRLIQLMLLHNYIWKNQKYIMSPLIRIRNIVRSLYIGLQYLPTVSISILGAVLFDKNSDLTAALAYCKLGIAIADAFVSCYKTNILTTSYVRSLISVPTLTQPGLRLSVLPFLIIPQPIPYRQVLPGILADVFGDNTTFTDYSINDLGFVPRTFNKFSDYANEVGLSRIYGGIHVRSSDFIGLDQGDKVGKNVSALNFNK
jgi:hypothetical protein